MPRAKKRSMEEIMQTIINSIITAEDFIFKSDIEGINADTVVRYIKAAIIAQQAPKLIITNVKKGNRTSTMIGLKSYLEKKDNKF